MEYTKLTSITWGIGLLQALNKMRLHKELCDLKIILENNVTLFAHSCVISAASPFLKSLLDNAENPELNMESFPGDIIRQIVDFVYTGTVLIKKSDLFVFHSIAATLNITALTEMAQKVNQTHINKGKTGGATPDSKSSSKSSVLVVSPNSSIKSPTQLCSGNMKESPLKHSLPFSLLRSPIPADTSVVAPSGENEESDAATPKQDFFKFLSLSAESNPNPADSPCDESIRNLMDKEDAPENTAQSGEGETVEVAPPAEHLPQDDAAEVALPGEQLPLDKAAEMAPPAKQMPQIVNVFSQSCLKTREQAEDLVCKDMFCDEGGEDDFEPLQAVEVDPREIDGVVPQELLQPMETEDSNPEAALVQALAGGEQQEEDESAPKPLQVIQHVGDDYVIGTLYPVVPGGDETENAVNSIAGSSTRKKRKPRGVAISQVPVHNGVTFMCEFCNRCFSDQLYYERHREKHISLSGQNPKRFKCSHCVFSSNYNHVLKEHERTHTGYKPHQCRFCEKRFSHIKNWKEHERTHGNGPKYTCEKCDKEFTSYPNMRKHMTVVHEPDFRPHKCPLCSKCFKLVEVLKRHMETHSRTAPYDCEFCTKKYWSRQSYLDHRRNKHEGKQSTHTCATCSKVYKTKQSFRKHICGQIRCKYKETTEKSVMLVNSGVITAQEEVAEPSVVVVNSSVKQEDLSDGETSSDDDSVLSGEELQGGEILDGEIQDGEIQAGEIQAGEIQ